MVWWVKLLASNARDPGSNPARGTEIPYANVVQLKNKKKKKNKKNKIFLKQTKKGKTKSAINRPPEAAGRSLSCSLTVTVRVTGTLTGEFPSLSCYSDPRSCPRLPKRALFQGRPRHSLDRSRDCILRHPGCYSQAGRGGKAFLAVCVATDTTWAGGQRGQ